MKPLATYPYPQQGKLLILGAGESGVGAALLGQKRGFQVMVSDQGTIAKHYKDELIAAGIEFEEGGHGEESFKNVALAIKSPGISPRAAAVARLIADQVPVIGEIEFAAQYTDAYIIAITGSNGKSTTASLTWYMLDQAGFDVVLAGNIGQSFARSVASASPAVYVLELSSFMLDDMRYFRADIAVLLNITPDHLDRYDYDLDRYIDSKFAVLRNQRPTDIFIYCLDDPHTRTGLERHRVVAKTWAFSIQQKVVPGAYLEKEELIIDTQVNDIFKMNIHDLSLEGKHNVYNNMASGLIAKAQELRNATMKESMGSYQNIPHRLEFVSCIAGVNYINDSKATNVNSVWYALESFSPEIVLIMGGVDKGNDYGMIRELVREKVKAIICIGKDNSRIYESLEDDVPVILNSSGMKDAVEIASHIARKGDTVLLSPACASFDWFKNYEDRGEQFKSAVMEL